MYGAAVALYDDFVKSTSAVFCKVSVAGDPAWRFIPLKISEISHPTKTVGFFGFTLRTNCFFSWCYVFKGRAIADFDFDDAPRTKATATANETRVDERNIFYYNILAFASSSERPPPRAATSKLGATFFGPFFGQQLYVLTLPSSTCTVVHFLEIKPHTVRVLSFQFTKVHKKRASFTPSIVARERLNVNINRWCFTNSNLQIIITLRPPYKIG